MIQGPKPFSWRWTFTSMAIFVVAELLMGAALEPYLKGYQSIAMRFMLQGLLHLLAFFVGGILVGLLSPGIRLLEPAAGAMLSVASMLMLTVFTPYTFMAMQPHKLVIGAVVAAFCAVSGAKLGERLRGNQV